MRWPSVVLLFVVAGPTLAFAWLAREQFRDGHPVSGLLLASTSALFGALLLGALLGEASMLGRLR